ncbi:PKD domain-containing protein [Nakamurella sp. YIM 132087]|uniref:PKD domain-containing protein n=1 Tax=Nakamurella alba TaxID=2665158 RepID=A0A7K1FIM7_9ACTN|nr:PKD domain-containing protein [Nakamurella alba]
MPGTGRWRRPTSLLGTIALTIGGLVAVAAVAPAASAAPAPIADPPANMVTADGLPTTQINGVAWDQVVVGNTVYVGGEFTNARPAGAAAGTNLTTRNNALAYNLSTGALVTGWNPNVNRQIKTIAASPDGSRIYIGGSFTTVGGVTRNRIAAINASTGALITTFNAGVDYTVNAISATDTTVYVAGAFSSANGSTRTRLAAFNASNGALTGWNPSADRTVNSMVISPDGAVIVGGSFENVNGSAAYGLAKIDASSGALLPWNATNLIRNAGANASILSLSTDGTAIYGSGYHFGAGGNLEGVFSADPATGNIRWVEDCHGDTYDQYAAPTGVIYSVSHAHYCGNVGGFPQSDPWSINMRHALAFSKEATGTLLADPYGYYNFEGTPSPTLYSWFPEMDSGSYTGKDQAAWSVTGNDQYVVMGGEFPTVNGKAQQGLVRFAVKPIGPGKMGPQDSGAKFVPSVRAMPSGAARVSWQANSDMDGQTMTYTLTRNGQTVYTTTAKSVFWDRPAMGYIDTAVVPGTTYKYRLTATDLDGNTATGDIVDFVAQAGTGSTPYAQQVTADGAAPYFPLDEASGAVVYDNAGFADADSWNLTRGTAGAITGTTASTFNGSNSLAATRIAVQGPDTFTAQMWIRTTTTSGGKILGFGNNRTGLSGSYDRHVYMDNQGRIFFGVYPGFSATVNGSASYNDGQWHQITAQMSSAGMKLYVDAKLVGQRSDVTTGQSYQGFWKIGGDNLGGWPNQPSSNYFAGAIDEVALYPTALTRQQVNAQWVAAGRTSVIPAAPADNYGKAVYNDDPQLFWRLGESSGNAAADSGPNGDQGGIYQNGVGLGAAGALQGVANTAATFDGGDDFVASTNAYNNPKNYSEEAWFKTTSTNGGKIIGFGSNQSGSSGGYDRHVYLTQDGTVWFGTWTGQENKANSAPGYNDGRWHHVVATQSTTDGMKLYLDGQLVGTNPQTSAQDFSGYWRVGGDTQWGCCSGYFNGTIDEAAVYNKVLSASTVSNHYLLGTTGAPANQAPTAAFTSAATLLDATFDGTGSTDADGTIASYAWNFGDNSTGTGATPSHSYTAAGTYQVTLTVTDNRGATNAITKPVTVTAPPPNQAPTAAFTSAATFLDATFNGGGSTDTDGTIASYAWNFGDNTTGTGATPSHSYTAAGTYQVTLTVTDDKGATNAITKPVTVTAPPANQAPTASFTAQAMELTGNFDATASSDPDGTIASYAWNFGDGTSGTGKTVSHPYAAAGTYQVTLTVTDNKGATGTSTQPLQVTAPVPNQAPTANFTSSVENLTVNVESTSTDTDGTIAAVAWNFGDGATATGAAAVHTYTSAGTYQVRITVTDDDGATGTITKPVTVTAAPPANVAPTAAFTNTANGLTAAFNGSTSTDPDGTITAYSWNFGDGVTDLTSGATVSHPYAAAGTYQVSLTVTDDKGATNTVTKPVTVNAPVAAPIALDTFGRTTANGLGSAETGGAWTVAGGNANFSVSSGTGKIRMSAAGAGPSATLGAVSAANVDVKVDVSLDKAPTGGGIYMSLAARKTGTSEYRTTAKFLADGRVQLQLVKIVNGTSTTLQTVNVSGVTITPNSPVTIRLRTSGTSSVALSAKVWNTGGTEPAAWQASATDSANTIAAPGGIALYPYLSGSATSGAVVASVDNLRADALNP